MFNHYDGGEIEWVFVVGIGERTNTDLISRTNKKGATNSLRYVLSNALNTKINASKNDTSDFVRSVYGLNSKRP